MADHGGMSIDAAFRGSLFANDFLCETVAETPDWQTIDDAALENLEAGLRANSKLAKHNQGGDAYPKQRDQLDFDFGDD